MPLPHAVREEALISESANAAGFGLWVRTRRQANRFVIRDLEARTGIRAATISRIENGKAPQAARDIEIVSRLAVGLGASISEAFAAAGLGSSAGLSPEAEEIARRYESLSERGRRLLLATLTVIEEDEGKVE